MKSGLYIDKRWGILIHIAVWVLFFSLPLLLNPPFDTRVTSFDNGVTSMVGFRPPRFNLYHALNDLLLIGLFYLNAYLLLPRAIRKRRIGQYLLLQLLVLLAYVLVNHQLFMWLLRPRGMPFYSDVVFFRDHVGVRGHAGDVRDRIRALQAPHLGPPFERGFFARLFLIIPRAALLPYALILLSSTAFRMIVDRIASERKAKEQENVNLKTELSHLRTQISPHFMFNVLNNMVSLARKGSDQLEPSLLKLSSLMRYMIYEVREDKVPLSKEIEYLQSYIDIQRQRFMGTMRVHVDLQPVHEHYTIEPMLLIPFVENAFKHGGTLAGDAEVDIRLQVEGDVLYFSVRNKYQETPEDAKDKTSGIGLANVRRRLNLLYGDRYHLEIGRKEDKFLVSLRINLH
ncbi:sensor histidine kinase [Compostibacter hankyongensis]|uniref:Signal transduction histidine kinase internal region domain-containing protein n=1 Tax=Compostibacter hankyongensis TaxID=1007089 RepID=A0ABP8FKZ6_9BACT